MKRTFNTPASPRRARLAFNLAKGLTAALLGVVLAAVCIIETQAASDGDTEAGSGWDKVVASFWNLTTGGDESSSNENSKLDPASPAFTNSQASKTATFQGGTPLCAPASTGLVAWLKGENNTIDSSGNGNTGDPENTVAYAGGKVGQSFNLNGTNAYIEMLDSPSLSPSSAVTLQAWIKPRVLGIRHTIISNLNATNSNAAFHLELQNNNSLQIDVFQSATVYRIAETAPNVINANVYQHVAATFDTSNQAMKIYVNGVEIPVTILYSNVTSLANVTTPVTIGAHRTSSGNFGQYFNGEIDEAQVYNLALSASEVAAIYNAGSAGVCTAAQLPAANGKIVFDSDRSGLRQIYSMNTDGSNITQLTNSTSPAFLPEYSFDGSKIVFARYVVSTGAYDIFTMNADGSNQVNVTNDTHFDGQPSFSPDGSKIVYHSNQNGNTDIFIMNSNGTNRMKMTSGAGTNRVPSWSPDGSKISFTSNRDGNGNFEVYIMNADGNNQTRLTTSGSHEHATFSPDSSKIVFYSDPDGNYEIYTMNIDGSNQTRLTNNTAVDYAPRYSPDGSKIVFASQRDGNEEIYTMNADGTNQTRATTNTATDTEPSWQPIRFQIITSPGTGVSNGKIAFMSRRTGNHEIFTMNADGSNQINVSNNAAGDFEPAWSPDGSKIAFKSSRNSNYDIYSMNADGSNQIRLTTDASNDENPSWSPDGTKIVFTSHRTGQGDIYLMNADGTNQTQITNYFAVDSTPKFSPDGSRIVFSRVLYENGFGNFEIYVMDANGTNEIRLTNNAASVQDQQPAFSPDGSKIVFINNLNNPNSEVFVMNANGTNPVNLTQPYDGTSPAWSPDGTKIAFKTLRDNDNEIYVINSDGTNPTRLTNSGDLDLEPSWQNVGGGSVTVAPASNVSVTFSNVTQAGNTVATPLAQSELSALPSGYALVSPTQAYDVRTSAGYSGNVEVTITVPNVANAAACDRLRSLHFESGAWTDANNAAPVFNAGTCAVSQTVTSLSPFAVAQMNAYSISGQITSGGNPLPNVSVALSGGSSTTTNASGNYSFANLTGGANYTVTPSLQNYAFTPASASFTNLAANQTANFTAASTCTYSINPTSANVAITSSAGNTIAVNTQAGCPWSAASNAGWITVDSGASGAGSGTVSYSVAANNTGNSRSGTITAAGQTFTVTQAGPAINVSIPNNLTALRNTTLTVPVNVSDTTGRGIVSFDFVLNYDAAKFTPLAVPFDRTGTLSNGYTVTVNSNTPGTLVVSGFGTTPLSGAGILLNLKFNAVGGITSCSNLSLSAFQFNDGNPAAAATGGQACVVSGSISGIVTYPNAPTTTAVGNVTLTAAGSTNVTATSALPTGGYVLNGLGAGAYTVTPSKTGEVNNSIAAFDASLVAQHTVGLIVLTAKQQIAADTSNNGSLNSFDAALIASYVVGLLNVGTTGTWKFIPASRSYPDVETHQTNQDYEAILMGEVSGNWTPPPAFAAGVLQAEQSLANAVPITLPTITAARNGNLSVPVAVGDLNGRNIMAYQFDVVFDPAVLEPQNTTPTSGEGTLSSGFSVVTNTLAPGRMRVAAFGTQALTGEGTLLKLNFRVVGQTGASTDLTWQAVQFNEGEPTANGTNGKVSVNAGTNKTVGVFRPTNGITYLRNSNTGGYADVSMVYGVAGDQSFAGDWNGDRIDSIGIYRNGVFYLRNSNTTGAADVVFAFGSPGDQPVAGDWNGDGIDTIGVYRPTTGVFYLRNSNTAGAPDLVFVLGNPGDVAISGDWNGDGITTTGVFRPTNGIIYLKNTNVSGNADIHLVYGIAGDKPMAGDWDGDGMDSIGIYREGVFYLRNSNTQGFADLVFALGNSGDEPIAGDWDGLP